MPQKKRILTLHTSHISNYGIGHAAHSLTKAMANEQLSSLVISNSIDTNLSSASQKSLVPNYLNRLVYKLVPEHHISLATESFFLKNLKNHDIAYLWPGCSLKLFQQIKKRGNTILMESINCHQNTSKSIIDSECRRLNIEPKYPINDAMISDENLKLSLCNYVFSPSPLVTQSLLSNHVPHNKIIQTSYGLDKNQQLNLESKTKKHGITAIFVGRVGMRKGIHLLLEYWQKANINGKLQIIGNVEENIAPLLAPYLKQNNIEFISFVSNLEEVYANADFFVLPSLEEGSPLVTYLALGAGLPTILSPMAGGGIINHGKHGFIVDPHNGPEWISAIKRLSSSAELRQQQSEAAIKLSEQFLWQNVGRKRSDTLLQLLEGC